MRSVEHDARGVEKHAGNGIHVAEHEGRRQQAVGAQGSSFGKPKA